MITDEEIVDAAKAAITEGFKRQLDHYNSPFKGVCDRALQANASKIAAILEAAISDAMSDEAFIVEIRTQARQSIASQLVKRFGGELDRHVNQLKSDPVTRGRIVAALEDIVRSKL